MDMNDEAISEIDVRLSHPVRLVESPRGPAYRVHASTFYESGAISSRSVGFVQETEVLGGLRWIGFEGEHLVVSAADGGSTRRECLYAWNKRLMTEASR